MRNFMIEITALINKYGQKVNDLENNISRLSNVLSGLKSYPNFSEPTYAGPQEDLPSIPSLYEELSLMNERLDKAVNLVNRLADFWEQTV